jgi:hypothetical protein
MGSAKDVWTLITDPAYPHSIFGLETPPGLVRPALFLVALLLAFLTVWTYKGVRAATPKRVLIVLALRLAALVAACLAMLRPSFAYKSELQTPSYLIVVVDYSESTTITDEINGQSRWAYVQRVLRESEPAIRELAEKQNITVVVHRFAGDVQAVIPEGQSDARQVSIADVFETLAKVKPDGKRTDFGLMLHELFERYRTERYLRGLVVMSDGADNGSHAKYQPLTLAAQWRNLPCPIQTFAVGKPTTTDRLANIILRSVDPESPYVPMKGELVIKAVIDAPGFQGQEFQPTLLIDEVEVIPTKILIDNLEKKDKLVFPRTDGNELKLVCTAPAKPGEIKVTVRLKDREMSTYVTITKEGISVLFVDRLRSGEPQSIIDYVTKEKRINLHNVQFRTDKVDSIQLTDLFKFREQKYDVIILGDVTPNQLRAGNKDAFATIQELVKNGAGLLFLGGNQFGKARWNQVDELKDLLPVTADDITRIPGPLHLKPVDPDPRNRNQFMLRLADDPKTNEEHWSKLRPFDSVPSLGRLKTAADFKPDDGVGGGAPVVLAVSDKGHPILVWKLYGKGRVLVFAPDLTYKWLDADNANSVNDFQRFWQRTVLWLARQEDTESNLKIELPNRRMPSGDPFDFNLMLKDKGGNEVKDGNFTITLVDPNGKETSLTSGRDKTGEHGTVEKEKVALPGEYRIRATGKGKDMDGAPVEGKEEVRFLIYQDETEMLRQAADHDFLKKLAATGGGEFHQADELTAYLKQLAAKPLPQERPKANVWPDWRSQQLSGFLVIFFLLFVALVSMEWFLRRRWGLV